MNQSKKYQKEMKRYRIIEHSLRDKSVFIVEWNDKWLFGLWGRWHPTFQTLKIEEAVSKIQRLVNIKLMK